MREILFRGKGNPKYNTGEWYEGYLRQDSEGDFQICGSCWSRTVIPETVGQYTGVCDKNGAKIFEGDIINVYRPFDKIKTNAVVQWNGIFSSFSVGDCGTLFGGAVADVYEIVGNIHDNPELLVGAE